MQRTISVDELREICTLTVELTRLRQNECKHLCVENVAAEIFHRLLGILAVHKEENNHAKN